MQQDTGRWLWLEWALATLIGYVVGGILALLVWQCRSPMQSPPAGRRMPPAAL